MIEMGVNAYTRKLERHICILVMYVGNVDVSSCGQNLFLSWHISGTSSSSTITLYSSYMQFINLFLLFTERERERGDMHTLV